MKKYQIKFKNSSVEGSWYSLVNDIFKPMERCKQFLQENPEDRLKSGGKLKNCKGNGRVYCNTTLHIKLVFTIR